MRSRVRFLIFALFALAAAAVDQITKLLVIRYIPLGSSVDGVNGLFHLTYVRNTGAAFSSFQGMRWLFIGIFVVLTAAVIFEYFKKPLSFHSFERWCLAAIYGGALGNVVDRIRLGYVVDMIRVDFIDFPVFNVADCFITCGSIALMIYVIFFNKNFWKDEKK